MKIRPGSRSTTAVDPTPDPPAPNAPQSDRRPFHRLRRIGGTALTVVMALALVLFVAMTVLRFTGGELLAIRTGSMEPKMSPGDLLISRNVDPRTVRRGDVITFRVPEADNTLVTHRVTKVEEDGNAFTTKGDANETADQFTTEGKDVLGRQWFVIPGVGRAMVFLSSGWGTLLLIAVPGSIYLGQTLADRRARRRALEAPTPDAAAQDAAAEDAAAEDAVEQAREVPVPALPAPPPFRGITLPVPPPLSPPPFPPVPHPHAPYAHPGYAPHPYAQAPQVIVIHVPAHGPAPVAPPAPAPPVVDLRSPFAGDQRTPPLAVPVDQLPPEVSERLGSPWALLFPLDTSVRTPGIPSTDPRH